MSSGEYSSTRAKCPYCQATYTYRSGQLDEEGSVCCQNCGKKFTVILSEGASIALPLEDDGDYFQDRVVETYVTDALRVKCPHCMATYVYIDADKTPDGFFLCQNCGKKIEASGGKKVEIVQTISTDVSNDTKWLPILAVSIILLLFIPWYISIPVIACICLVTYENDVVGDREFRPKSDQGLALD